METVRDSWTFYLFAGIAFILLGLFAVGSPYVMTYSIELLLGWVLLISGVIQGVRAFISKESTGFFWSFISAAVTLIVGLMLLTYPLAGMITLTLLLAVYFLVDGISSIFFAVQNWGVMRWTGLLLSGILSLVLAFLIWSGWPTTAMWVIGLYVGIYLLFLGIAFVMLAFQARET